MLWCPLNSILLLLIPYHMAPLQQTMGFARRDLGCHGCAKQAIGRIAPELGNFSALQKVDISNQFITGPLSDAWSQSDAMQELKSMLVVFPPPYPIQGCICCT